METKICFQAIICREFVLAVPLSSDVSLSLEIEKKHGSVLQKLYFANLE
jgi:hypothetical protein